MTRRSAVAAATVLLLGAAACSGNSAGHPASALSKSAKAPLTVTVPHLLMTDPSDGWAVWPSGESWVLLRTSNGWQQVSNATPVAVPTGGGLVVGIGASQVAVAVGAYERLVQSPLLTKTSGQNDWSPAELPGAIANARGAVGVTGAQTTAVVATSRGQAVVRSDGQTWTTIADTASLNGAGDVRLDSVTWADATVGWITGHGAAGAPVAFQTDDGGKIWARVAAVDKSAVAALAPCGGGQSWVLPVISSDDTLAIERTSDDGATWTAGAKLPLATGSPVWGCHDSTVWVAARSGHATHVFTSVDAGATWTDRGKAPDALTDLAPVSSSSGFAASGTTKKPVLWTVTDSGAHFARVALPGWVATLGAQMSTS